MSHTKAAHAPAERRVTPPSSTNTKLESLSQHFNKTFTPLQFPPAEAQHIITHLSHCDSVVGHNSCFAFLGACAQSVYGLSPQPAPITGRWTLEVDFLLFLQGLPAAVEYGHVRIVARHSRFEYACPRPAWILTGCVQDWETSLSSHRKSCVLPQNNMIDFALTSTILKNNLLSFRLVWQVTVAKFCQNFLQLTTSSRTVLVAATVYSPAVGFADFTVRTTIHHARVVFDLTVFSSQRTTNPCTSQSHSVQAASRHGIDHQADLLGTHLG